MEMRRLGRTALSVTRLGFGAWAIGGKGEGLNYGEVSEADAIGCLEAYIEAGGNHIDTARYYNESERLVGQVIRDDSVRESLVIASKTFESDREGIRRELETSLNLLQTDIIDLYYLHVPPGDVGEMDRALDVMEELREEGRIRAIGASIRGPAVTQETVDLWRQYIGTGRIDAIQLIYSIFRQRAREVFDEAAEAGVALIGRTALESGFLTGKYGPDHRFGEEDHRARWSREWLTGMLAEVEHLERTAVRAPYQNLAQVALRFAMQPDGITSTIVGGRTPEQVRRNLAALELPPLDGSMVARLLAEYGDRTAEFNGG